VSIGATCGVLTETRNTIAVMMGRWLRGTPVGWHHLSVDVWTIVGPTSPYKGGIAQHTTELAHRLAAGVDDVAIESWRHQYPERLYPGARQTSADDYPAFEPTHRSLSWKRPHTWVVTALRLRRRGGTVVFVGVTPFQYPIYMAILAFAGRRVRHRSMLIAHNVTPHEASRVDKIFTALMFRMVTGVLTHSARERDRAVAIGAHATNAVLPFHFDAEPIITHARVRHHTLAFVGFVRPYKGLDMLLDALAQSDTDFTLEVLGEFWSDATEFIERARQLGIADRCVIRPGYATTNDIVELLDRADALVLPYRSATSSQLPRVAFLRGAPVVATDVGDFAEQVRTGIDGIICQPNVSAIAGAIEWLANDTQWGSLCDGVTAPNVTAEWVKYVETLNGMARWRAASLTAQHRGKGSQQ